MVIVLRDSGTSAYGLPFGLKPAGPNGSAKPRRTCTEHGRNFTYLATFAVKSATDRPVLRKAGLIGRVEPGNLASSPEARPRSPLANQTCELFVEKSSYRRHRASLL
jgi:hypothetical protein